MMESGDTSYAAEIARFLKLIANTNRLLILDILQREEEANVGQLEQVLGVSQPALSQHLARMRQEGILETCRRGQHIFYSIKDNRVRNLLPVLKQLL